MSRRGAATAVRPVRSIHVDVAVRQIVNEFTSGQTLRERIAVLEGAGRGRHGVALTCGPSLSAYTDDQLAELCEAKVVIAVKQAIDRVPNDADFICFNAYNVRRYSIPPSVGRVYVEPSSRYLYQFNRSHLRLPSERKTSPGAQAVLESHDYDRYLLAAQTLRPFGPGIMHEVVLYLAVHLGLSRLDVLGWDLAFGYEFVDHFYDSDTPDPGAQKTQDQLAADDTLRFRSGRLTAAARVASSVIAHPTGRTYNSPRWVPGERELVQGSIPSTQAWMSSHGCELVLQQP